MARLLVGLPALHGDLEKYATRFELVELRLSTEGGASAPKPATLRKWRKAVPPSFVFSVVLPRAVAALTPGPALDAELASALETAAALEARCLVLQTPPEVRPTAANKKRLAALFDRIPREGTVRCWEPSGLWERDETIATARAIGVLPVLDVAHEVPAPGLILYTRLRALGKSSALGAAAVERIAERLRRRRESFVVVEGTAAEAQRIKAALATALTQKPGRAVGVTVVRAATSTLVAEDEEQ
jgi:uncharacterized protein YecE (DUF72 family)